MRTFQNLRITAYLLDGRIATYDGYLPLDSMLAYAKIRSEHPEWMEAGICPEDISNRFIQLPLAKVNAGTKYWYWACSFACFKPLKESSRYWHKRFDQELAEEYVNFGKRRGTVNVKSARYKNYRMPLTIILTPKIDWYCVGDAREIAKLLPLITHIGKKPAQGLGAVKKWEIAAIEEDLSWLRPIPDENGDDEIGIRPPYWWRENIVRVRWPEDERLGARAIFDIQQA